MATLRETVRSSFVIYMAGGVKFASAGMVGGARRLCLFFCMEDCFVRGVESPDLGARWREGTKGVGRAVWKVGDSLSGAGFAHVRLGLGRPLFLDGSADYVRSCEKISRKAGSSVKGDVVG